MIDSECTNHMTGKKKMFSSFETNDESNENIVFGNNSKGKVLGLGKVAISNDHSISNVFLVNSLNYNLLSVSQLCEMSYNCLFTNADVTVFRRDDSSIAFKGHMRGKLYLVDFSSDKAELETCLVAKSAMSWLWHHRLAHVGMRNLHKLQKGGHILGLTNVSFEKDKICRSCQAGKQVEHNIPPKTSSQQLGHWRCYTWIFLVWWST